MAKWKEIDMEADTKPQTVTEMVLEFVTKTEQVPTDELYAQLIIEEYKEWLTSEDVMEEMKELTDLVYVIYGYALAKGFNLEEAVRRVHKNNLGRCIQPDGSVQRRPDGKILKNKDYPKVQLEDLMG
jgi:predicted HAD superfamily Cof-like phosphohydrolase